MKLISRQISGLGNQLFQYAAGLYYSRRYEATLRIAIDEPQNAVSHGYPRPFLLSHFQLKAPALPLSRIDKIIFSPKHQLRPAQAVLCTLGTHLVTEPPAWRFRFNPDLPLSTDLKTLYLFGYWQNYQIAEEVAASLRQEFQFRNPATGQNLAVLNQIQASETAISLHIRRGDYTLAAEGNIALPVEYYTRAIAHIRARVPNPTFFVFSDDIPYARANLPAGLRTVFVDHNDDFTSHEDLRLMSSCRHHIIANSSFSWWGAWLNPGTNKIVAAPKYWHLKPTSYFPDICPPEWTLLAL